jgi:hypothetical protein
MNPVRNSSGSLNLTGIILKSNSPVEPCAALNQNGSEHRMVYRAERRGIISNGVNGANDSR